MRSRLIVPPLAWLALSAVGACSANVVSAGADANTLSTHALLVVEQTVSAEDARAARSHVSMWFLRVADEQDIDAVTRLVTDVADVPPNGSCVNLGSRGATDKVDPTLGSVELAFAGDVAVEMPMARVALAARAFPDVANLVSGVMYTAPGQTDLKLPLGGPLTVHVAGNEGLPPLIAQTDTPTPPEVILIEGTSIQSPEAEARRGRPLSIAWNAGPGGDLIYVDVDPIPGSPSDRVRCAMPDTGVGQISAMAIPETQTLALSMHRVRATVLRTATGEVGTAHFDVAVTGRVRVAAP